MVFPDIDPFVFGLHWGNFGLRWYALAYVVGILLGWRYILRLVRTPALWGPKSPTMNATQVDDLVLWATLGVIVGGRLGSVLFYNTSMIWEDPLQIFMIWKGGMSFHGGLIGVIVVLLLFGKTSKIPLLALADLVAAAQPIGQFFGRIANFINGELWGRPTEAAWGVVFCNDRLRGSDGTCLAGEVARHPSQLYEAALEGLVLFLILRFATHRLKWLQRPGAVAGLFLLGYAAFRILLENVRAPDAGLDNLPLGLTMGMILSAPMAIAGAYLIWRALKAGPVVEVGVPAMAAAAPAPAPAPVPAAEPKPIVEPARKPAAKPAPKAKAAPKPAPEAKAAPKTAAPKTAAPKATATKPAAPAVKAPAAKAPAKPAKKASKRPAAKPKAKPGA